MKRWIFCILTFSLVLMLLTPLESDAQRRNKYKKRRAKNRSISSYRGGMVGGKFRPYDYIGFNINALNYFGDLAPVNQAASTDVSFTRPGIGVLIGHKFHPNMAVRASLNWGRLKGDDFTSDPGTEQGFPRYARNLSFRNDIKEFQVGMEFYLIPNYGGPNVRPPINAYLFIGAAVFHHNPKGKVPEYDYQLYGPDPPEGTPKLSNAGEWIKLRPLGTEGQYIEGIDVETYSTVQFSVPIALGATMQLSGPFDIGLELGYRYLFTDYLDDVSGGYVGLDRFDDPVARIMSDRGAEPVAVWNGEQRLSTLGMPRITYENGESYYIGGDVGGGIDGSIRGNPKDNDMYFVTSIKLTMILGRGRSSAKFR